MKNNKLLLALGLIVILTFATACSSPTSTTVGSKPMSAEEITNKLKKSELPIDNIIVYTEDTDVNKLLGRPNQYISKTNFADTTVEQGNDKSNPVGGSIETFSNPDDLKNRKEYCESITKKMSALTQYYYVNGNYLLRIDGAVTPNNAKKYAEEFAKIK